MCGYTPEHKGSLYERTWPLWQQILVWRLRTVSKLTQDIEMVCPAAIT